VKNTETVVAQGIRTGIQTLHPGQLRKSPEAMQKASGLSVCAGRAFSSLSPHKRFAGLRGEVGAGSKPNPSQQKTTCLNMPFFVLF